MDEAVLIVDDCPEIRELLAEFFRLVIGVQTFVACHAREAAEIFRANFEIGAIVSDYWMGEQGLNGDDLHRELKDELDARRACFALLHGGDQLPSYFKQLDVMVAHKPLRDPAEFAEGVVECMRRLRATA